MEDTHNVSSVNEIVNVKTNQASLFQFMVLALINWIHSAEDNIMQLYFTFSWVKSSY